MKLFDFLPRSFSLLGRNQEITNLSCDTRTLKPSSLYFCIKGERYDGHVFAIDAVKAGACAVVSEKELDLPKSVTQIIVQNARAAMSEMASNFNGNPDKDMLKIAVTGTNGKTTTTFLLRHALTEAGYNVGVIGTNGSFTNRGEIKSSLTTPDPIELFKIIKEMKNQGVDCLCFEASAHALSLDKLAGIVSDIAILTNITQDHLDFFKTMPAYAMAKAKLFTKQMSRVGIINTNTPLADAINYCSGIKTLTVGEKNNCDIKLIKSEATPSGQVMTVNFGNEERTYNLKLSGKFNAENALNVIAVGEILGLDRALVARSLESAESVPGRFNTINKNGISFVIDYAHTPDGIKNALTACRDMANERGGRVIAVFGCGGNRDASKRQIMGKTACDSADYVIITSDNPRYEDPKIIISNIIWDIKQYTNYETVVDRSEAIRRASLIAKPNDVVAILGKGCENYLEINGTKVAYSDESEVRNL